MPRALLEKCDLAARGGLDMYVVTQFRFVVLTMRGHLRVKRPDSRLGGGSEWLTAVAGEIEHVVGN